MENEQFRGRELRSPQIVVTATGAIVNQGALDTFEGAHRIAGDRASALTILRDMALREDWARRRVAAAGKSWATHLAKFSGAVVPR